MTLAIIDARPPKYVILGPGYEAIGPTAATAAAEALAAATASLATANALAAPLGSSLVGYTAGPSYITRTIENRLREEVSLWDYIPLAMQAAIIAGTSTNDVTTYVQAALNDAKRVIARNGKYRISGDLQLNVAGQRLIFDTEKAVFQQTDATKHLFKVQANGVSVEGGTMLGCATAATNSVFAFYTDVATPAQDFTLQSVNFSGTTAAAGFTNIAKADQGSRRMRLIDISVDSMMGQESGYGYVLLVGNAEFCELKDSVVRFASGRGRHAAYFSAGASRCKASGNDLQGGNYDMLTSWATAAQSPCVDNEFSNNILANVAQSNNFANSAIAIFENCQGTRIHKNKIRNSGGCGIRQDSYLPDGNTVATRQLKDTEITRNEVRFCRFIGIENRAADGGSLAGNYVYESSQAAAVTYSNIRLISDTAIPCRNMIIEGNRSAGPSFARSALQINALAPLPTRAQLTIRNNRFELCSNFADVELNGAAVPVDGLIKTVVGNFAPGAIAAGASVAQNIPASALQGDFIQVAHVSSNSAGLAYNAVCANNGSIDLTIQNRTAASITPASGSLLISAFAN